MTSHHLISTGFWMNECRVNGSRLSSYSASCFNSNSPSLIQHHWRCEHEWIHKHTNPDPVIVMISLFLTVHLTTDNKTKHAPIDPRHTERKDYLKFL
jgi:hypothetical protein